MIGRAILRASSRLSSSSSSSRKTATSTATAAASAAVVAAAAAAAAAAVSSAVTALVAVPNNHNNVTRCDTTEQQQPQQKSVGAVRLRKRKTLEQANNLSLLSPSSSSSSPLRRVDTKEVLSKLRPRQKEIFRRWEEDEDGWHELPARAWPAYQPNPTQLKGIREDVVKQGCVATNQPSSDLCTELLFNVATSLVFYNIDAEAGFRQFLQLAKGGHVDSMVACGIILVEGFGVPAEETKGIEWLRRAIDLGSPQACYEMGGVLYTGIDGVLDEDPTAAFEMFERAAEQNHTAAMFMMADCLVEGEGTPRDVARAVPLFFAAAERGHRYARQRVRQLLAEKHYQ